MKLAGERKAIEAALDAYRAKLDSIPDELFNKTPLDGGWSCAEVYSHILQSTIGASVAAEKCTQNTCKPTPKGTSWLGKFLLLFGRFPVAKVKTPEAIAAAIPATQISKEDARNLLVKCRHRIEHIMPLVFDAPADQRIGHPRFGMMNARQWFKFIRIHLQHHLKQLERIEKKI